VFLTERERGGQGEERKGKEREEEKRREIVSE
jgi:hypothetical protein